MSIELAGRPGARSRYRRALAQPIAAGIAGLVLAVIVLAALAGSHLVPYDADIQHLGNRLLPPGSLGQHGRYLLGTDGLGRDVLSLVIMGARPALLVSISAVASAAVIGVLSGIGAGFHGGRSADFLLYLTNIQLAFPFFLLAITVVGILRPSVPLVIMVIAMGSWVPFARVAYSDTVKIRGLEFIEAVRVMRGTNTRMLLRHVLPNVIPNALVLSTFALGTAIVMESGLSFVGLGVPTETPTWGRMLSEGRDYMDTAWWLTACPGVCIFLLVLAVNVIGEQLRDYADPKLTLQ